MKKRFLSLLTVFAMCFSLLPGLVLAEDGEVGYAAEAGETQDAVAMDSDGKYYSDIQSAVKGAADGSKITVIAESNQLSLPDGIYVNTGSEGLTLDLDGHSLGGYSLNVGGSSSTGKLTVIDSSGGNGAVGLTVRNGGTVIFESENVNTALLQLQVYGGDVMLRGGHIDRWELYNNVKLSDLIPSGEGYAYRFYRGVNYLGNWVPLADAQNNTVDTTFGLAVMKCEHAGADADNHCLYCGQTVVAKNGDSKYYTDMKDAVNGANANDTITMLKEIDIDYGVRIEKDLTIDLGGHNIDGNITICSGNTLKLNGQGTVTVVQSGTSEDSVVGGALDVLSDDVIVGKLVVQQSPTPEMNLSKGTFYDITLTDHLEGSLTVNQLLANGYAFAYPDGRVANGNVRRLIGTVKIVAHVHDTSSGSCDCGYTCDHANGFTDDGKCPDCGLQCPASVVDKTGAVTYYANLQDAIKAHNALANDVVMLLTDAGGSYTVGERQLRINLNGHTVQSLLITGSGSLALQGLTGKIQNLTFNGAEAKFASGTWPVLDQITISGGASWSSILPDSNNYEQDGNYYGYQVYRDNGTHKWYDRNTAEACAEETGTVIKNVKIQSLPIVGKYTLMVNGETIVQRHAVSNKASLKFTVKADTSDASCTFYRQNRSGDVLPQPLERYSNGCYEDNNGYGGWTFGAGTYRVWAVLQKDGYECKTEVFDIVSKPDFSNAVIQLKESDFTYTPLSDGDAEEFKPEIESVTLDGKTLDASEYDIGGEIAGTDARGYTLTITAKKDSGYIGTGFKTWTIKPCVLSDVGTCIDVKNYDGTKEITEDNIGKNVVPPHFYYNGCPAGGIELKYGEDYSLSEVKSNFSKPDAGEYGTVSFEVQLKNSNYTFEDEEGNKTTSKTVEKVMCIGKAALPTGYEPDNGGLIVRNGFAHTYTYDVSQLLKELPNGLNYGTTRYALESIGSVDNGYIEDDTVSISENGKLTVPVKAVYTEEANAEIAIVTVKVTMQNYSDITIPVTVYARNRIVLTGEPILSRDAITYGEPISSIGLSGTMHDDTNNVDVQGTFAWNAPDTAPDAGDYEAEWTFTPTGNNAYMYVQATGKAIITVNKAAVPDDKITARPEKVDGLVYDDDTPLVLHTEGRVADGYGTMKYTTVNPETAADGDWQDTPISARNAGDYIIYYKVFGDENHLDSAYGTIECGIAKYKLTYSVVCSSKVYDGSTAGDPKKVDNVTFYSDADSSKEITGFVNGTDYTVDKIEYKSANVGGNLGTLPVDATATLSLLGDTAINYTLTDGTASGLITPAPFTDIDFNSYTYEICYGETTPRSATLSYFGAPDKLNYKIYSDMVVSSNDILSKLDIVGDSYFNFAVKEGLRQDAVGKSVTVKFNIYSKDHNYCSEELTFTVKIIDKATPKLYVNSVSAVYNGEPVPASLISGTAKVDGHEIPGTWSWENGKSPTNVSDSREYIVLFEPTYSYLYYGATIPVEVTITPKPIGDISLTLDKDSFIYNGSAHKPTVTAKMNETKLAANTDYTVTYPTDMTNAGAKVLTVQGHGNFTGEKELPYTIETCNTAPVLTLSPTEYTYDGTGKKPVVTVTVEGRQLAEGQDYEVAYANNTNAEDGAKVTVTSKGNYNFAPVEQGFAIHKAPIQIQPQDVVKAYGQKATLRYTLSGGDFLTPAELDEIDQLVVLASDGVDEKASADANGYAISAQLKQTETANLLLSIEGTAKVVVNKAPLTVKVKDVSREYGADNPPLEVEYSGFVNGEDESVLTGELQLVYADGIGAQTPVGSHPDAAAASGLAAENYEITYETGTLTVTKIGVAASPGAAGSSYLNILLDRELEGLKVQNFTVSDGEKTVGLTGVRASLDNKTYTLYGSFKMNKTYTVTVNLSGAAADATHQMTVGEVDITPRQTGRSSGTRGNKITYTITFETNGGSKIQPQVVAPNNTMAKPKDPTKDGFDFAGWYTDKALTKAYDFAEKATKSMTLYAAWTEQDDTQNQIILTIGEKAAQVFGRTVTNDVAPLIQNDRTMLPARFVAENLGAKVTWDADKRLVTITGKNLKTDGDMTLLLTIDSDTAYVNGKEIRLDSPSFIDNDRTYTPVRFIAEALGAEVSWEENGKTVTIQIPSRNEEQIK